MCFIIDCLHTCVELQDLTVQGRNSVCSLIVYSDIDGFEHIENVVVSCTAGIVSAGYLSRTSNNNLNLRTTEKLLLNHGFVVVFVCFLAFDFCWFCVVIRFFHPPCHNGQ